MVAMSGSRQATPSPAPQLGSMLPTIRAEPDGGYLAYLDFTDVFEPDGKQVEATFRNLARKEPSDKLSRPGWIGFFGYEFLAAHLGLSLRANRDLAIPDGWFGRPKTVIRLLPDATRVESEIPGRGREISDLLKKETQPASHDPGPSHSIACNLEFGQYEGLQASPRTILDGETYQIKIANDSRLWPQSIRPG